MTRALVARLSAGRIVQELSGLAEARVGGESPQQHRAKIEYLRGLTTNELLAYCTGSLVARGVPFEVAGFDDPVAVEELRGAVNGGDSGDGGEMDGD